MNRLWRSRADQLHTGQIDEDGVELAPGSRRECGVETLGELAERQHPLPHRTLEELADMCPFSVGNPEISGIHDTRISAANDSLSGPARR